MEPADSSHNSTSETHIVNFMRFPGEIRNSIYDLVLCSLPFSPTVTILPAIAFVSTVAHREFMSKCIPSIHYNIRSMAEIWYLGMLLDMHSQDSRLRGITALTITNFTTIARTQARANEVMDFLCQFESLTSLSLDITLDDLHHGLQGRIKAIQCLIIDFELFQILEFPKLIEIVVNVKRNGNEFSPGTASLLAELSKWFREGFRGDAVFIYSE